MLPDPVQREHYDAFFDYVESGWSFIRPLQLEAEADRHGDIAEFVEVEVTDNFRWMAEACTDMLPTEPGLYGPNPPTGDLDGEMGAVARNLRLLAMMEHSPAFPARFRGIVGQAASGFTAWASRLDSAAGPIIEAIDDAARMEEEDDG